MATEGQKKTSNINNNNLESQPEGQLEAVHDQDSKTHSSHADGTSKDNRNIHEDSDGVEKKNGAINDESVDIGSEKVSDESGGRKKRAHSKEPDDGQSRNSKKRAVLNEEGSTRASDTKSKNGVQTPYDKDEKNSGANTKSEAEAVKKSSDVNGNKNKDETANDPESDFDEETGGDTPSPEEEPTGTLLICGGANWDMTGRKELPKTAKKTTQNNPAARNLWGPHKVRHEGNPLRVRVVASGCNACHSVIVADNGDVMTFGRNDKGQLGLGDTETRITPTLIEDFKDINIVAAACGRSHTLFLDSNGIVYSCGDNKMGQCGTNQMAVQQIVKPTRIAFRENKPIVRIACGAEFSMIVDIDGRLYSFGHPEHGQLGHNSEGKYFTTGNKYAFHCEYAPRRITTFVEKSREGHVAPVGDVSIVDIACGTNHTLAVDKKHRCFSWGFAGYHRLGHSETKNELVPRSIKVFDVPGNSGRGASKVFAGATHSMALDMNGLLYFWGQNKSSGEATMYPKNVQDLCGWRIKAVSCANRSIFVIADDTCISWGPSPTYGELGYGEGKSKSSTIPQEVKSLDGIQIMDVACGFGHTLLVARDQSSKDLDSLKPIKDWP